MDDERLPRRDLDWILAARRGRGSPSRNMVAGHRRAMKEKGTTRTKMGRKRHLEKRTRV